MKNYLYPNLWAGCVGAWCPSEDRSRSDRLTDFSGRNNHGVLTGMEPATDWVASQGKVALDFDGQNDLIAFNSVSFDLSVDTVSLACWFSYSRVELNRSILQLSRLSLTGHYFGININNLGPRIVLDSELSFVSVGGPAIALNTFVHAVAIAGPSFQQLYLNGRLVGSATNNRPAILDTLNIGSLQATNCFPGQIDDARVYNRALSPSEIATLALRRGVAYETERPRRFRSASAPPPTNNRKRSSRYLTFPG